MKLAKQLEKARKIFLDTAPVIYFVEKNPDFAPKAQEIFNRLDDGKLMAVVSPITLAECLVLPYKQGSPDVAQVFTDLLVTVLKIPMQPGKSRVVAMKLNSPIAQAA